MTGSQVPGDAAISFENLMRTGQELMQRFEKAMMPISHHELLQHQP